MCLTFENEENFTKQIIPLFCIVKTNACLAVKLYTKYSICQGENLKNPLTNLMGLEHFISRLVLEFLDNRNSTHNNQSLSV